MSVSEIHHVAIPVTNVERSVAFYEHVLGYRPTLRMNLGGEELENYGVIRSSVCKDPDGYLLEFVRLPTREEVLAYRSKHTKDT